MSQLVQNITEKIIPKYIMRGDLQKKQKNEQKMRFIFRALNEGYLVKRNEDDSYSFTIDKSRDVPLKTFVRRCSFKLNEF